MNKESRFAIKISKKLHEAGETGNGLEIGKVIAGTGKEGQSFWLSTAKTDSHALLRQFGLEPKEVDRQLVAAVLVGKSGQTIDQEIGIVTHDWVHKAAEHLIALGVFCHKREITVIVEGSRLDLTNPVVATRIALFSYEQGLKDSISPFGWKRDPFGSSERDEELGSWSVYRNRILDDD